MHAYTHTHTRMFTYVQMHIHTHMRTPWIDSWVSPFLQVCVCMSIFIFAREWLPACVVRRAREACGCVCVFECVCECEGEFASECVCVCVHCSVLIVLMPACVSMCAVWLCMWVCCEMSICERLKAERTTTEWPGAFFWVVMWSIYVYIHMIQSVHICRLFFFPGVISYMFMHRNDVYVHIYEYMNEGATTEWASWLVALISQAILRNYSTNYNQLLWGGYDEQAF